MNEEMRKDEFAFWAFVFLVGGASLSIILIIILFG